MIDPAIPVLYEDDDLVAFDKPAGLAVIADRWDSGRAHLMEWVRSRHGSDVVNVHRLDRDTSGVLLCAKNARAMRMMTELFAGRAVRKRYLGITRATPARTEGTIAAPLAAHPRCAGRMRVHRGGKPSETEYAVDERWRSGHALLSVRPKTGRTHQIRVHLAHIGCPILGDRLYGDGRGLYLSRIKRHYKRKADGEERPLIGRLALHAERVTFRLAGRGQPLTIAAPLPKDLSLALKYLRLCQAVTGQTGGR